MRSRRKSGERKKSPFLFGLVFRIILIAAAASMFLSYLSVYVNPSKFALPLFFGLYFIPILAINLLLFLAAVLRRSASAWIALVAILPAILYSELFFKIGYNNEAEKEGIELKIESYNVGMFSSSERELDREECRQEIGKHITEEDPHILCLQEFFAENYIQADTIYSQYPYRHYHLFKARNGKLFGNIILSKFPIGEKGRISFYNSTNLSIFADIKHYGRTIRVYNNHLQSYNVSFTTLAQKFAGNNELDRDEITRDIVETHEKMKGTFIKRSEQVGSIIEHINKTSHRAIICGDFNDTPMSYTYHTLARQRKDTFKEAGKGFGASFIPIWPLLRIDYLIVPQEAECLYHTVHKVRLSDHYPISSSIVL